MHCDSRVANVKNAEGYSTFQKTPNGCGVVTAVFLGVAVLQNGLCVFNTHDFHNNLMAYHYCDVYSWMI